MTWTDKRPTEAGEYWVSVVPRNRKTYRMSSVDAVVIDKSLFASLTDQTWIGYVSHSIFDGAKWSRRETPADPFAKADTMRTDQDGREYNHDDRETQLQPDLLVKKAIQHLRKRKPKNGRGYVYPLWKRVADLFGHGSGYSAEICHRYGFDPDEQWMPEQQCPDCKRMVDPDELRPAPCNYEQEVNGNDTPFVMCRSCRSERNDAI